MNTKKVAQTPEQIEAWLVKVAPQVLPLSTEPHSVPERAMLAQRVQSLLETEWEPGNRVRSARMEECGVCLYAGSGGRPWPSYLFLAVNDMTGGELWVGSTCIEVIVEMSERMATLWRHERRAIHYLNTLAEYRRRAHERGLTIPENLWPDPANVLSWGVAEDVAFKRLCKWMKVAHQIHNILVKEGVTLSIDWRALPPSEWSDVLVRLKRRITELHEERAAQVRAALLEEGKCGRCTRHLGEAHEPRCVLRLEGQVSPASVLDAGDNS